MLRQQEEKDARIMLDLYTKMTVCVLHDAHEMDEDELLCFLGNHKRLFQRHARMVREGTQLEYFNQRMAEIFPTSGFPQQFFDDMLGAVEEPVFDEKSASQESRSDHRQKEGKWQKRGNEKTCSMIIAATEKGRNDMTCKDCIHDCVCGCRSYEERTCIYFTDNSEVERLKEKNEILSRNADTAFQDGLNEAQDLYKQQIRNEVAREIFEEIRNIILDDSNDSDETMAYDEQAAAYYEAEFCRIVEQIKQLEKKYEEGGNG